MERATQGFKWPDTFRGPWHVTVHLAIEQGVVSCSGLDVRSFTGEVGGEPAPRSIVEPAPEVTSTVLRSIPVGELVAEVRRDLPLLIDQHLAKRSGARRGRRATLTEVAATLRKRGRKPKYGQDHYERVAEVYASEADRAGGKPTQEVAKRFFLSHAAAAKHVARCRELGLITPTRRGRSSSRPKGTPT